jgi:hypothetical protein
MSADAKPHRSFSAGRRFNSALHAALGMLAVAALVVMANYLAARHSMRWFLSARSELQLSPRTLGLLRTLTNQVTVTVFYDHREPYFSTVVGLLREYHLANPRIQVQVVDYLRDAGAAHQVFTTYQLAGRTNKNLIIFHCATNVMRVDGNALMEHKVEVVNARELELKRSPVAFHGELAFTVALLMVTNPRLPTACFLTGHEEHALESTHELQGYSKVAGLLWQNCIQPATLSLAGTNAAPEPEQCSLLVIAGPLKPIPEAELDKIEQYLDQGGRLLALLSSFGTPLQSGLERVLAKWGVEVSTNAVVDLLNTKAVGAARGSDLFTSDFTTHAAVMPLHEAALKNEAALHLIRPRAVSRRDDVLKTADALAVEELVRSASTATLDGRARAFPLALAVEKGAVKGVVTQRGTTRLIVVGDSVFLGNQMIESASNRDFASSAVNWLLDRPQLLHGLGPRRVDEFRLALSQAQLQTLQWLLLGALPGAVLTFGGLVWLRRRS